MKKSLLNSYSIMPLDLDHFDEICQDIKEQYENGVSSCALFSMTLVPEGSPPVDKVGSLCKKYKKFQDKLNSMGIKCGVLVQASVGHGWVLGDMFGYSTHVNFCDGVATRCVCPCDDGFKDYIYNVMRTIAMQNPECIMVDDDFRLIWYKGEGCGCDLHMARFNEKAKSNLTRAELWSIVNSDNANRKRYTDIFIETQMESLVETAKVMRQGIDSVNPQLPASYCCCGNNAEFAYEIASVLAGEGNPITVRINNGNYAPSGARFFSRVFQRAATQIAKLRNKVDVILAETDTCPQNRYSTSAMSLHTHYTGTILEGANGAKHWISRMTSFEKESGAAYRRVLSKNLGFYEKLAELTPTLKWRGCRIHTPSTPDFTYGRVKEEYDGWSYCVLERLGLPMYFSSENGGVACLEGDIDVRLSDDEILKILSGPVILASDTAKNLIDRGFGKYLGVNVRAWNGKTPITERIHANNCLSKVQRKTMELVPLSENVTVSSVVYNTLDYESFEPLFPGCTTFKNELGGTVIVFCGSPVAEFNIVEAFSFLNYSRKQQLIELLKSTDELLVYYPNDEEVYFKCADMENGDVFCSVFNIGLDPIEKLELCCSFKAAGFEKLLPDGTTRAVDFTYDGKKYILDTSANTLDPVVIFIKKL